VLAEPDEELEELEELEDDEPPDDEPPDDELPDVELPEADDEDDRGALDAFDEGAGVDRGAASRDA
jgi:hypothetical protein